MRYILLVFLLAIFSIPGTAFGKDTYTVVTDFWPPFRIQNPYGIGGIDMELLSVIGKRMHIDFETKRAPWARCLIDMEHGNADIMTGLARTPEREKYIAYTSPEYFTCSPAFYERADRKGPSITTYEQLRNVTIGYTRGSAYFEPFDSDMQLNKIAIKDEGLMLKMMQEGRWDIMIGTDCQVDYDIRKNNLESTLRKVPYQPDVHIELYIGISRKSPLLKRKDELEEVLQGIINDGTMDVILGHYFSTD